MVNLMARPFLSDSQVTDQRRRLTLEALSLYRTQGVEAVTLRRLAARAGMSHFTPYRYFQSKDELLAAIKTEVFAHFAEHLESVDLPEAQPIDRLRHICRAVVDFARRQPEDYRLIFSLRQPPVADYPPLQAVWTRTAEFVISVCQKAIDAGQLQGDARTWAHLAWSSIHGLLSLHLANLLVLGRDVDAMVGPLMQALLPTLPGTINHHSTHGENDQ